MNYTSFFTNIATKIFILYGLYCISILKHTKKCTINIFFKHKNESAIWDELFKKLTLKVKSKMKYDLPD